MRKKMNDPEELQSIIDLLQENASIANTYIVELQSSIASYKANSGGAIDANIEANLQALLDRSNAGIAKCGVTTDKAGLPLRDWLNHALEETLDNANYFRVAITSINEENKKSLREKTLQELADQAQKLDMGY